MYGPCVSASGIARERECESYSSWKIYTTEKLNANDRMLTENDHKNISMISEK